MERDRTERRIEREDSGDRIKFFVCANDPVRLTDLGDFTVYPGDVFDLSKDEARCDSIRIALRRDANDPTKPWIEFYDGNSAPIEKQNDFDSMYDNFKNRNKTAAKKVEKVEVKEEKVSKGKDGSVGALPDEFSSWNLDGKIKWVINELEDLTLLKLLATTGQDDIAKAAKRKMEKLVDVKRKSSYNGSVVEAKKVLGEDIN